MSKIHSAWLFVCRHKYIITALLIALIVGVIDQDSYLNRHPRQVHIDMLRQEIAACKQQYDEADRKIQELKTNPEAVAKIARERYLMKRADEDIYVIASEKDANDDFAEEGAE